MSDAMVPSFKADDVLDDALVLLDSQAFRLLPAHRVVVHGAAACPARRELFGPYPPVA